VNHFLNASKNAALQSLLDEVLVLDGQLDRHAYNLRYGSTAVKFCHVAGLSITTLQVTLDSISRPGGNAAAKKIAILRPHRDLQHESDRDNRPIFGVSRDRSLPRQLLEIPI
jgi:hypothetical protein